jgi:hypothetical protein
VCKRLTRKVETLKSCNFFKLFNGLHFYYRNGDDHAREIGLMVSCFKRLRLKRVILISIIF